MKFGRQSIRISSSYPNNGSKFFLSPHQFQTQLSHLLIIECLLYLTETIHRLLPVVSCKTFSFQPKSSRGQAYVTNRGVSPSSRNSVFRRAYKADESSTTASLDNKSSSKENLISLFNRIQFEISQGESERGIYSKSSQASTDDGSLVETSVLEFLLQSDGETKGNSLKLKLSEESKNNVKSTKKEKSIPTTQPPSTNNFIRPPSKFVKKSPIPSSTPSQSTDVEVNGTEFPSSEADKGSSSLESMKLSELKALAKERGIRGYSKLKKNELIQLLRS